MVEYIQEIFLDYSEVVSEALRGIKQSSRFCWRGGWDGDVLCVVEKLRKLIGVAGVACRYMYPTRIMYH
jgi:hypothetical protein